MKKVLIVLVLLLAIVAVGIGYFVSNAGDLIKQQVEKQGSHYLGTPVSLANVDLALQEGRLTLGGLAVKNPEGFSSNNAFNLQAITLDVGNIKNEPYVVQRVNIEAPEVLYELNADGKGNLIVLKDNLTAKLPVGDTPQQQSSGPNPLVIVEDVQISKVKLKLNFENLDTRGVELPVEQRAYEVELPTFSAGSIGKPDGLPADQVGAAIADKLLDNVITQAKAEAKKRVTEAAKDKIKEELKDKTKELEEKAKDKLKNLFGG